MRIAVLNWSNRRFGGTGSYLSLLMPALHAAGHEVALWHEVERPSDRPPLSNAVVPGWSVSALGLERAVAALRSWHPDVLYAHGLLEPAVERRVLDVAPSVFFAHDYYGTCISGLKTCAAPVTQACTRTFGWQCLARYYPNRCGGLSPITMLKQFHLQSARLDLLSRYSAIVTHSQHMRREYMRHGFDHARVIDVGYGAKPGDDGGRRAAREEPPSRLLFVGRMDRMKGGRELLEAVPEAARRLGRRLHLTFAGDGPERGRWEAEARAQCAAQADVSVTFLGWVGADALREAYDESDLLAVPSLWPEPLGLVGIEASQHGLPAVAFDVGGISTWLTPGVNGMLAPGAPPTVDGLASAIAAALDEATHARLVDGAQRLAATWQFDAHLGRLMRVFDEVRSEC
jgi:glycosyltransferase involved in cell wall biosynthesis